MHPILKAHMAALRVAKARKPYSPYIETGSRSGGKEPRRRPRSAQEMQDFTDALELRARNLSGGAVISAHSQGDADQVRRLARQGQRAMRAFQISERALRAWKASKRPPKGFRVGKAAAGAVRRKR